MEVNISNITQGINLSCIPNEDLFKKVFCMFPDSIKEEKRFPDMQMSLSEYNLNI